MLERDALQLLLETAVGASKPTTLYEDSRQAVISLEGSLQTIDKPCPPRRLSVASAEDLAALIDDECAVDPENHPTIFVGPARVVCLLQHGASTRDPDWITMRLDTHPDWLTLTKSVNEWLDAREMIARLRYDLRKIVMGGAHLLEAIKAFSFTTTDTKSVESQRTRETFGRNVSAEVVSTSPLPETVPFVVPRYATVGETQLHTLNGELDVDVSRATLRLRVNPFEFERVTQNHLVGLRDRLRELTPAVVVLGDAT